jgi:uncharacterized protein
VNRPDAAATPVNAVLEQLWRYPVKSMLGERITAAAVTEQGVPGDRRLALVDRETGRIASAKAPRLWRGLLRCSASIDAGDPRYARNAGNAGDAGDEDSAAEAFGAAGRGGEAGGRTASVRIDIPGGKPLWHTDADVDERLTAYIGRTVHLSGTPEEGAALDRSVPEAVLAAGLDAEVDARLMRLGWAAPAGSGFVDFAPLHLITTSTLDRIAQLSPRGTVELERYRPNLVIRTEEPGFVENEWLGREIRIGKRLRLLVIAHTARCAVPTLEHGHLPRDTAALRILAGHNRIRPMPDSPEEPCAGVYAQVLAPGGIVEGDRVLLAG